MSDISRETFTFATSIMGGQLHTHHAPADTRGIGDGSPHNDSTKTAMRMPVGVGTPTAHA